MPRRTAAEMRTEAILRRPQAEIFAFLNDIHNLGALGRGAIRNFRILSPATIGIGATAQFKARSGGLLWQRYTVEISESVAPDLIETHSIDAKTPFHYTATWRLKAISDEVTAVVLTIETTLKPRGGMPQVVNTAILLNGPGPWIAMGNSTAFDTAQELFDAYAAIVAALRDTFPNTDEEA